MTIVFTFKGRKFNYNGYTFYLSAEIQEYLLEAANGEISGICYETFGRRLYEKANPYVHFSDFPRDELRDLCKAATDHHHYRHILPVDINYRRIGKAAAAILSSCATIR
jgi:hypothetical protein